MEIGVYHNLTIDRQREPGLFLSDENGEEVLLPNRYIPENFEIGDSISVFVYLDNEGRPVATTDSPFVTKNDFAVLRCNQVNNFGAFLEWGLVKELFCPFKEQVVKMVKGEWYLVYCYLDETTNRLVASSKTNQFLNNSVVKVEEGEEVELIVSYPSELGMNVIINNEHLGLIFNDEIFKDLSIGDRIKGYIKKIRPDNKITVTLQKPGHKSIEPNADHILTVLKRENGFLPLTDKSSPEEIQSKLELSKKSFKKAIGTLYKKRLIDLREDGIYLN
ncbi:CvfB family protein [Aegicerativicinus sediminis]|uniref:CvfB family protein n=1 Tax=Aegicerativicinus sediminis TaxID=2893202 RepID=UPI001E4543F8|nr:S1-like domain-containing RNA-binding protein [Aegicerativicinus sediminis]